MDLTGGCSFMMIVYLDDEQRKSIALIRVQNQEGIYNGAAYTRGVILRVYSRVRVCGLV